MHRFLNNTDTTPPPLNVSSVVNGYNVDVTVQTDDDIYQEQPWIAAKPYNGICVRLDTTKTDTGTWEFSYSKKDYDHVSVGISDTFGNEIIADVDDGSKLWGVQSEFLRAQSSGLDFDTTPTLAILKNTDGVYASEGTIAFDYENKASGSWTSILVNRAVSANTSLTARYKTANSQELLDSAVWSDYYTSPEITLPDNLTDSWIRIEARLQGDTTTTPELDSIEVNYETAFITTFSKMWQLFE